MNHTLREHDPPRRCNRDMRKQTWESEGLAYAGELAAQNFTDRGLTYREGFELARKTWEDVRPITHYSEPARLLDRRPRPQHPSEAHDSPAVLVRCSPLTRFKQAQTLMKTSVHNCNRGR